MLIEISVSNGGTDKPSRRLLKALFSGAIPVTLFAKNANLLVSSNNGDRLMFFESEDFERTILDLSFLNNVAIDYAEILNQPLENLKDHLIKLSNGATLRSLFWDQLLNRLFRFGLEGRDKQYLISSEWNTRKLLLYLEVRKVDFEVSIKP